MQVSAVEALARREPMGTDTLHVPRTGDFDVEHIGKGGTYGEDVTAVGEILLTARKMGKAMRLAEEDKKDTAKLLDVVATKKLDWARNYAKYLDNATLAVSGAESGTPANQRPFTSLYYAIRNGVAGPEYADVVYTANANYFTTTTAEFQAGTNTGYDDLSGVLSVIEEGDYFEEDLVSWVGHPRWKRLFREMRGSDGHPILIKGNQGAPDTLMGYPIKWTLGAKVSATATKAPPGNALLFCMNTKVAMCLGVRSGPESAAASAETGGPGFLTDEDLIKMRARRGFRVGDPNAAAVLQLTG
jgi:HK97 family phage major capsid protein